MSLFASNPQFAPTEVTRFIKGLDTAAGTLLVETDAGMAYLKAIGNPAGPHALACELVATRLAGSIGLPTFDYALVEISPKSTNCRFREAAKHPPALPLLLERSLVQPGATISCC